MSGEWRVPLIVASLLIPAFVSVAPPVSAFHWCDQLNVSMDPLSGYGGDDVALTIMLKNNIDEPLEVSAIEVHPLWQPGVYDWGPMSLTAHGSDSQTWVIRLPIPSNAPQAYTVLILVYGRTPSDGPEEGCTASKSFSILLLPPPLVTADPNGGWAPLEITFSVTWSDGLAPFVYSWTFGDGSSGSGSPVSHVYTSPGTYTPQVVVIDSRGRSATENLTIAVTGTGLNIAGLGDFMTLILLIVAIVAVAAVVLVILLRRRPIE